MTRTLIIRSRGRRLAYKVTADSLTAIIRYARSLRASGYKVSVKGVRG